MKNRLQLRRENLSKTVTVYFKKLSVSRQNIVVIASVLVFAAIGTVLLVSSRAATPTVNFEVEAGTTTSGATAMSDSTASAGNAIKFTTAVAGACAQTKRTITTSDVNTQKNSGYPAGTQVYVPDGPDPWGGCFPGPSNTGIPAGTTLTAYSGSCTITTANTTIDGKTMNCDVTVRAANVTIKNSKITGRTSL